MAWKIRFSSNAEKQFCKLDKQTQKLIVNYLEKKLSNVESPRVFGKNLVGEYSGFWRYRVGDYRIICDILDKEVVIEVVKVGHRKNIY